jgi:hypothetical protein
MTVTFAKPMYPSPRYLTSQRAIDRFVKTQQHGTLTQPADVAGALSRLLAAYEPQANYVPMQDGDFYGGRLRRLAAVQLAIVGTRAKFKVGPASPPNDARQRTVAGLRTRNNLGDARAADVIEAAISDPPER